MFATPVTVTFCTTNPQYIKSSDEWIPLCTVGLGNRKCWLQFLMMCTKQPNGAADGSLNFTCKEATV